MKLVIQTGPDRVTHAEAQGVQHRADMGRWKTSGVPLAAGIMGLQQLLTTQQWQVEEIAYFDEKHAIFLASKTGRHTAICH